MLVPVVALLFQRPWHNRASFNAAMAKVQEGMSPAQVRTILGPPDDVWTPADKPRRYVADGDTVWCYGSEGHLSLPVLGNIHFYRGRALVPHWDKPIPNLPPESVLVAQLRAMDESPHPSYKFDALKMIRVVNDLRPLGKRYALATMIQYDRLMNSDTYVTIWLDEVASFLFENREGPDLSRRSAEQVRVTDAWPHFPFVVVNDIPFLLGRLPIGGYIGPFEMHVAGREKDWTMRSKPLSPPDDPFHSLVAALAYVKQTSETVPPPGLASQVRQEVIRSFQTLLREVDPSTPLLDPEDTIFEVFHRSFLERKLCWSAVENRYVIRPGE